MERLLSAHDIAERYGLSIGEARNLMNRVDKVNVGNGNVRPRWRTTESNIDAYLRRKTVPAGVMPNGKLVRR